MPPPRKKPWIPEHLVDFLRMPVPDELVAQIERESAQALEMAGRARPDEFGQDNLTPTKPDTSP